MLSLSEPRAGDLRPLVEAARHRLTGFCVRTPTVRSPALDDATGAEVWVKAEGLQRTGSFKFRGAFNAVSVARERGAKAVVAYSSGNHACAVAAAGRLRGMPVTVLMPSDAPAFKVAAAAEHGATIVTYDRYRDDRYRLAADLAHRQGAQLVPSADSPHVIAGAATAVQELLEDSGPLDLLLVPVGGGGLLAGAACVLPSGTVLTGVEPEASDDLSRSLTAGHLVSVEIGSSAADGLLLGSLAPLAWGLVSRRAQALVVTEDELATGMRFATDVLKLVAEPSAVAGLGALLRSPSSVRGLRVGVVLTGANVGHKRLSRLLHPRPDVPARRPSEARCDLQGVPHD